MQGLAHKVCFVCGDELERKTLDIISHSIIHHEGQAPTCTEFGWEPYDTCSNCSYSTFAELDALGHTEVIDSAVAPTCTATGFTEGKHCGRCNKVFISQQIVNTLEHDYTDWVVGLCATKTANGYYSKTCTNCQHEEYQTIFAYGNREIANIKILEAINNKVDIPESTIDNAIKDILETNHKEIIIKEENNINLNSVSLSNRSLQKIANAEGYLTIKTGQFCATFDNKVLNSISASINTEIEFSLKIINQDNLNNAQKQSIEGDEVISILSAEVIGDNENISDFQNGKVKLRIPYVVDDQKSANYKIIYVSENGSIEEINTSYENGEFIIEVDHFSEYVLIELKTQSFNLLPIILVFIVIVLLALFLITNKKIIHKK